MADGRPSLIPNRLGLEPERLDEEGHVRRTWTNYFTINCLMFRALSQPPGPAPTAVGQTTRRWDPCQ